jgi:hypothetical protein
MSSMVDVPFYPADGTTQTISVSYVTDGFPRDQRGLCAFGHGDPLWRAEPARLPDRPVLAALPAGGNLPLLLWEAIMTPSERLLERLRAQGVEIPKGSRIHRTYANGSARTAGAWSWFILGPDGQSLGPHGRDLGSYYPVKVCLRALRLVVSEEHRDLGLNIDPDPLPALPGEPAPR